MTLRIYWAEASVISPFISLFRVRKYSLNPFVTVLGEMEREDQEERASLAVVSDAGDEKEFVVKVHFEREEAAGGGGRGRELEAEVRLIITCPFKFNYVT